MEQDFWQIVANPAAGGGRVERQRNQIQQKLHRAGIQYTWQESKGPMQAVELVHSLIREGRRKLAILGGDGTVNEVVNGVMTQKRVPTAEVLLALLPAGTGGDFARMYKIHSLGQGIRLLNEHDTFVQDAGVAHWQADEQPLKRYFCNVAGLAFDAYVTAATAHMNKAGWRGTITYLWAVLRNLWRYDQDRLQLAMAQANWKEVTILANAGICRHNGGGMNLVPAADPQDGLFDISTVAELTPLQVLQNIAKLYNGNLYRHPKASHHRSNWLEVRSATGLEVDGEYLGVGTGRLEIIPGALRIAVPRGYKVATR